MPGGARSIRRDWTLVLPPRRARPTPGRSAPSAVRGSATVEHAALALLVAAAAIAAALGVAAGLGDGSERSLPSTLARKLRCAAQGPGPCWRDPLTLAYGRSVAGAVRALAPAPASLPGPEGEHQVPVDFRRCRRSSCAIPDPASGGRLTTANRRVSVFTAIAPVGRKRGVRITYWLYRPLQPWEAISEVAGPARLRALGDTPLLESAVPKLVPLETLAGRNHYEFASIEEPPWRWRIEPVTR